MQDLRTKRHVIYSLHLHLVFVTKYRKKVFTKKMYERLNYHFDKVCNDFGWTFATYNTLKACQQFERGFIQVFKKGIPRIGKILLEGWFMVSKLFYSILWRGSSWYRQRIHWKTVDLCLYPVPEANWFYALIG